MSFVRKSVLAFLVAASAGAVSAQPSFSLKTNSDFPSLGSDFGFRIGMIEPYLGISNYSLRIKEKTTYQPDEFDNGSSSSTAASVFITSLGLRLGFRDEGVKPYVFANIYKLFTILDVQGSDKEDDDAVEELYSPFGFGAGFGAEYAVAKGFAVFGEYGFRALFPGAEEKSDSEFEPERTEEISMMFSALSGAAGIRFYF